MEFLNLEKNEFESFFLYEYVLQKNYGWVPVKHKGPEECPICWDTLDDKLCYKLPCGHIIDYPCIYGYIIKTQSTKKVCPHENCGQMIVNINKKTK